MDSLQGVYTSLLFSKLIVWFGYLKANPSKVFGAAADSPEAYDSPLPCIMFTNLVWLPRDSEKFQA